MTFGMNDAAISERAALVPCCSYSGTDDGTAFPWSARPPVQVTA
ncbi:hypothetical protein QF046_001227 [Microbacterium sp. W4I4]|nr:hypothetical protein [Microbacterium sp. W4I4]MDQ0613586.1 hypothetical protein [Microbacterium sp. W4I4]